MDLYSFFNSSASYRVRIVLALKGLKHDIHPVNIRAMEHKEPGYVAHNPNANVPMLDDEGFSIGQSLAIIDYLDNRYPQPRLIPRDLQQRARVLEMSNLIACDIHPVNNLRILRYLTHDFGLSDDDKRIWYHHWLNEGFSALETMLERLESDKYCVGGAISLADCCLVPQVANALRMNFGLSDFPRVAAIYEYCGQLAAFQNAAPAAQPDYLP